MRYLCTVVGLYGCSSSGEVSVTTTAFPATHFRNFEFVSTDGTLYTIPPEATTTVSISTATPEPDPPDNLKGVDVAGVRVFQRLTQKWLNQPRFALNDITESCPPPHIRSLAMNIEYTITELSEKGSFCRVRRALAFLPDGAPHWLMVKVLDRNASDGILRALQRDKATLEFLQVKKREISSQLVPHVAWENQECELRTSVMSLAGDVSLSQLAETDEVKNLAALASIAVRGLELLRSLHSLGIVHGDMHMDNMVFFRRTVIGRTLRLIDFGRARPFVDLETQGHILAQQVPLSSVEWTKSFLSIFELDGWLPTRRDDVWRLSEMLIDMMVGRRDLVALESTSSREQMLAYKRSRLSLTGPLADRLGGVDTVFIAFADFCSKLSFEARPDYETWIRRFARLSAAATDRIYMY